MAAHDLSPRSSTIKRLVIVLLPVLLLASFVLALTVGSVTIGWRETVTVLLAEPLGLKGPAAEVAGVNRDILLQMRLPRVLAAAIIGASLAVAGATFQGLFRNPMADPYVLGVSSGASLGAAAAILSGATFALAGFGPVPLLAFAAGLATLLLVYRMARVGKTVPVMTLLLAGIAVSAFLSALVSLLTYLSGERLHLIVFWMMGGLGSATWPRVLVILPYAAAGFACIYVFARELNALLLGEETARNLGVDTEKVKTILLAGASLLVAAAVSSSGVIGFVGLVVPHFIRLAAGPDHRFLLPASALLGAVLLMGADAVARVIIAPAELPVGVITALVGAPMFVYLLRKRKKLRYFNG